MTVWLSNKPLKWEKDATHSSQTCLKTSWVLEKNVYTLNQANSYLPIENMHTRVNSVHTQKPTNPANQKHDLTSHHQLSKGKERGQK